MCFWAKLDLRHEKKSVPLVPKQIVPWFLRHVNCRGKSILGCVDVIVWPKIL